MYRTLVLVLSLVVLGSFREAEAQSKGSSDGFKLVDRTGNIIKPRDDRDQYEMLGSWTVLDPKKQPDAFRLRVALETAFAVAGSVRKEASGSKKPVVANTILVTKNKRVLETEGHRMI